MPTILLPLAVLVLSTAAGAILARAISCLPREILLRAQNGGRYFRLANAAAATSTLRAARRVRGREHY